MTPADFKAAMPAFAGTDDASIQRWITASDPYFDADMWGGVYARGLNCWIGHSLLVENTASGLPKLPVIGQLATSKKVGTEAIGYSEAMLKLVAEDPYNATALGREYLSLISKFAGRGAMVV